MKARGMKARGMKGWEMSDADRRLLWQHMRTPARVFVALMLMLGAIVLLGALVPSHLASMAELALTVCMVLTVLLFSMEVIEEPPLLRFFSFLGFCWMAILFGITLVDYLTR